MSSAHSRKFALVLIVPVVAAIGAIWVLNSRNRQIEWKTVEFGENVDQSGRPVELPEGHTLEVPEGEMNGPALTSRPEIDSETPKGFADLVFHTKTAKFSMPPIGNDKEGIHGQGYAARGTWKGKEVGFEVLLIEPWEAWTPKGMKTPLYRSYGFIRSTGAMSDLLLQALATLYEVKPIPPKMAQATMVEVIALQGNPNKPKEGIVKLKLFFAEDEASPDYGELFLNIDLNKGRLTLVEKDTTYRGGIVRTLGGSAD